MLANRMGVNKAMKTNKGAKIGLAMHIISFAIIILLILFNKTIPDVIFSIFVVGTIISLIGTLGTYRKINKHQI